MISFTCTCWGRNECFFSLFLSNLFNFFSWGFLAEEDDQEESKMCFEFFLLSSTPPSPGERREEKVGKKIFYTCTRYIVRCALYRQVRERSKRTRSIEEYARILYFASRPTSPYTLFVQSAFPICNFYSSWEWKRLRFTPWKQHRMKRVPRDPRISIEAGKNRRDRRSRFDAAQRDEQICGFVRRHLPRRLVRLPSPPPHSYCTFEKIMSKFCSSDISIF